jgi:hypothetical protein
MEELDNIVMLELAQIEQLSRIGFVVGVHQLNPLYSHILP